MKFGVREICDVVLRAKAAQKIGNKIFYKNEPVIYFDTLKTSSMEGQATTVYAQGGRGNTRLMAWEGERTVTFTMEDALISPEGFMILSGAGLIEASADKTIKQHMMETIDAMQTEIVPGTSETVDEKGVKTPGTTAKLYIPLSNKPYVPGKTGNTSLEGITIPKEPTKAQNNDKLPKLGEIPAAESDVRNDQSAGDFIFVMLVKDGEIVSEPFIPDHSNFFYDEAKEKHMIQIVENTYFNHNPIDICGDSNTEPDKSGYLLEEVNNGTGNGTPKTYLHHPDGTTGHVFNGIAFDSVIVDYYVERVADAQQIEITADKFGGNYYLEASTLFRNESGVDMPAEFIIPNCKVQSNFTFSMASSGDPSTFTFTMDAFPDYTRFDHSKKVIAAIQIIRDAGGAKELYRHSTAHETAHDNYFLK